MCSLAQKPKPNYEREIIEAYEILSNADKRRACDNARKDGEFDNYQQKETTDSYSDVPDNRGVVKNITLKLRKCVTQLSKFSRSLAFTFHVSAGRARHPFVFIGKVIISAVVLALLMGGMVLVSGKQRFDVPGPLGEDRLVNIPRGSGIREIADVLLREGVIDRRRRARTQGTRGPQGRRISVQSACKPARSSRHLRRRPRGDACLPSRKG
jgi:hypothetical protein